MKKNIHTLSRGFAVLILLVLLAGQTDAQVIRDFSAARSAQGVLLQWTTVREVNVEEFRVQRSFDGQRFITIHTTQIAGGGHTYSYLDDDLYKGPDQTWYYRVEIKSANERVDYSITREVTLSFSGIRRTWGSIKAMFR